MNRTLLGSALAVLALGLSAGATAASGYDYYARGDTRSPGATATSPGLLLMGGGDWVRPALNWFAAQAGHGHIVILRASGAADMQDEFSTEADPVRSIETIVFHSRAAASDPRVLRIVRHADGIFLGGGDQSNYVRYWRGTPLNAALDAHVRAGRPIGGTSAGLAILGAYSYGALDGDSLRSDKALRDPLGPGVTLVRNFLHLPFLRTVITDSHFAIRERLGRLVVFVARLAFEEGNPDITGLGIDEQAALCIDAHGQGRLYSNNGGYAWLLRPRRLADVVAPGKALGFSAMPVTGIGADSLLDLRHFTVDKPAFNWLATASEGTLKTEPISLATAPRAATPWSLAIHGGAGVIERGSLSPELEAAYRASLNAALAAGAAVLSSGGSSLDAVESAVRWLEDDPLFNAGKGAVFTATGRNELDAAIMDGSTRRAGSVTGVTRTRNPVTLARAVMEQSTHVFLSGAGADAFSLARGLEQVDPHYYWTERRWHEFQQWRTEHAAGLDRTHLYGTVGAVALDAAGHLAAATSTGGLTGKRWGRIGDSPVIGAGTYAQDGVCAVSATGSGEYFIRANAAHQLCDRLAWKGATLRAAADDTIADIGSLGGDGGLIALDAAGHAAFAMNTPGMYRGAIAADHPAEIAIYAQEAKPVPAPGTAP